jgi:hypothetical protein
VIPAVFPLTVAGVGDFTFRRRTVPALDAAWTEDDKREVAAWLGSVSLWELAMAVPTVGRLMVAGPPGWNLDQVDPLDREQTDPILVVYRSLRAAEDKFRQRGADKSPTMGAGA